MSSETRLCECCGKELPAMVTVGKAKKFVRPNKNRFCDASCSAKWRTSQPSWQDVYTEERAQKIRESQERSRREHPELWEESNKRIAELKPSLNTEVAQKVSETLRRKGHKPSERGGNGRPMTVPQVTLLELLGSEWTPELAVTTGGGYQPHHYKIDLAHAVLKVAVEIDGPSHNSPSRRAADKRKDEWLRAHGWTVLRYSNQTVLNGPGVVRDEIMSWCTTSKSEDTPPTPSTETHTETSGTDI